MPSIPVVPALLDDDGLTVECPECAAIRSVDEPERRIYQTATMCRECQEVFFVELKTETT